MTTPAGSPLHPAARALIEGGALGHLVTRNADGSPQVTIVWVGVDGDELVTAHLGVDQQKLKNIRRDPHVVLSFEATSTNAVGMRDYLVIYGTARLTDGGAPELLQRLAQVYVGPGTRFPRLDNPPPGHLLRITPQRIRGQGPWTIA
jgi:PPOX class probable F420-dependent enzyme